VGRLLGDPKIWNNKNAAELLKTEGVEAFLKEYGPPESLEPEEPFRMPIHPPPGYKSGQRVARPRDIGSSS